MLFSPAFSASCLALILSLKSSAAAHIPYGVSPRHHTHFDSHALSVDNYTTTPGPRSLAYYGNWFIYGRNFTVDEIPATKITHLLYGFANINTDTGEVYLSDPWADTDKHFAGDSWDVPAGTTDVYGNVKQLFLLKKANRNLKTLLSIGGWTYRANFAGPASTESGRQKFASSAVRLLADLGFDGLDIDWEYPNTNQTAHDAVLLFAAVRAALDAYSLSVPGNPRFFLTGAFPMGPDNYEYLRFKEMDVSLDHWFLMAYDYAGPGFSNVTAHQANVECDALNPASTPFNTEQAVDAYVAGGVPANKLVLGMPVYGREFANTQGLGKPFNGTGVGSWEAGVWDYKALSTAFPNATVNYNPSIIAAWLTSCPNTTSLSPSTIANATFSLVTYDTPISVTAKCHYLLRHSMLGAGIWEISADIPACGSDPKDSLVNAIVENLGGEAGLEQRLNVLEFPNSTYGNIRGKMGGYPGGEQLQGSCP